MKHKKYGNYEVLELIGKGGMAEVYKVRKAGVAGFEKIMAMKRITEKFSTNKEFISMFINEANLSTNLSHQNVVQILELFKDESNYFIIMDYILGKNLKEILTKVKGLKKRCPINLACFIISNTCQGLDYAHRLKDKNKNPLRIVHLDISPQNILISFEGEVKVTDFGIARASTRIDTDENIIKGKFPYMSPEQTIGKGIDYRSDIFSLGIVFYEILSFDRPFDAKTRLQIVKNIRESHPTPLNKLNKDVPEDLNKIIMKALEKNKNNRYKSCNEFKKAIDGFIIKQFNEFPSNIDLAKFVKGLFYQDIPSEYVSYVESQRRADTTTLCDETITRYREKIYSNPDDYESLTKVATLFYYSDKLEEAKEFLNRAIEVNPDYVAAHQKLAEIMFATSEEEEANKIIRKLKKMNVDTLHLSLLEAKYYISSKNFASAETILKMLQDKHPDDIDIHLLFSELYQAEGNVKEMLKEFNKISQIDSDFAFLNAKSIDVLDDLFSQEMVGDLKKIKAKKKKKREELVMVVDDDRFFRKMMKILLEDEGFEVLLCKDGFECMNKLEEHKADLLVVDIVLPKINGFELAKTIIKKGYKAPIIFVSGVYRKERYKDIAYEIGIKDYFYKPVQRDKFLSCVEKRLREYKKSSK